MNFSDTGRRQGVASKTDEDIVADSITAQLRWASQPLEAYWVVRMGRLDELNGPAAYLFPTEEAAENFAAVHEGRAWSRGIEREITITYPKAVAA